MNGPNKVFDKIPWRPLMYLPVCLVVFILAIECSETPTSTSQNELRCRDSPLSAPPHHLGPVLSYTLQRQCLYPSTAHSPPSTRAGARCTATMALATQQVITRITRLCGHAPPWSPRSPNTSDYKAGREPAVGGARAGPPMAYSDYLGRKVTPIIRRWNLNAIRHAARAGLSSRRATYLGLVAMRRRPSRYLLLRCLPRVVTGHPACVRVPVPGRYVVVGLPSRTTASSGGASSSQDHRRRCRLAPLGARAHSLGRVSAPRAHRAARTTFC